MALATGPWLAISTLSAATSLIASAPLAHGVCQAADSATSILLRVTGHSYATVHDDIQAGELNAPYLKASSATNQIIPFESNSLHTNAIHTIPAFTKEPGHPLLRELQKRDFVAQIMLSRSLLLDLQRTAMKQPVSTTEATIKNSMNVCSMDETIELAVQLVGEVLDMIEQTIALMEQEVEIHQAKWFHTWRKCSIKPHVERLLDLSLLLDRRTQTLLQLKAVWR